jgi:hypothetical protein
VAGEVEVAHFCIGHLDAGGIGVLIEFATNLQTCRRRRRGDQLDDDLMADERLAAPVSGNEREEAMLDLVPLAGAGWQVTHGDGNAELVGQLLELDLPQSDARAVAAAAIGGDQQTAGVRVANEDLEDVGLAVNGAALGQNPEWLPAVEQFGEGFFIRFSPEALAQWLIRPAVLARAQELQAGPPLGWMQSVRGAWPSARTFSTSASGPNTSWLTAWLMPL